MKSPAFSVIIPVYKESRHINEVIEHVRRIGGMRRIELIVVDGEDNPSTLRNIEDYRVIKLKAEKGRALQMNRGAREANGDILLFLHADTRLPENAFDKIAGCMEDDEIVGGAFTLTADTDDKILRRLIFTSSIRSQFTRIPYGDQGIFIRTSYFRELNGFNEIPLMEDVDLMKRIRKKRKRIHIIDSPVITSARRWQEEGVFYGWLRNHFIRFLYILGVSPNILIKFYPDTKKDR